MRSFVPALLVVAACGGGSDDAPDSWLGDDPHVSLHGSFDGTELDLQLDDAAAADLFLELDWQWEDPAEGFISFEESAVSGTVEIAELSGEPGSGVVMADDTGALGVWFDATWETGSLAGSLTVHCGPNEVE